MAEQTDALTNIITIDGSYLEGVGRILIWQTRIVYVKRAGKYFVIRLHSVFYLAYLFE